MFRGVERGNSCVGGARNARPRAVYNKSEIKIRKRQDNKQTNKRKNGGRGGWNILFKGQIAIS